MIKKPFLLISMLMLCILLGATVSIDKGLLYSTNQEKYDYQYIVELYEMGDNTALEREIPQFFALYPDSAYLPYIHFLEGNMVMDQGDNARACNIYAELINVPLSQEVEALLLINYSTCLVNLGEYSQAMQFLQKAESEFPGTSVNAQSNLLKADIYYRQGLFYSAEKAYKQAVVDYKDDAVIRFRLFETEVKLEKDEDALALIWNLDPTTDIYGRYIHTWLLYLFNNERYAEFDAFLAQNELGPAANSKELADLRIRRAVIAKDYDQLQKLLQQVENAPEDIFKYYRGLLYTAREQYPQADSLFRQLIKSSTGEIAILSYLERLKIMYKAEPLAAISQLTAYLSQAGDIPQKAEAYYTLGYFCYQKQDYPEAIKQLSQASQFATGRELSSRIDILIADAWLALNRPDIAIEHYNRYLNLYPNGRARDKALFYVGYVNFTQKDYPNARNGFNELIDQYPQSVFSNDAKFYLAEIDFYLANYNLALERYLRLQNNLVSPLPVKLRIAQTYYYMSEYANADSALTGVSPSYDVCILKGVLSLSTHNYSKALEQLLLAEQFAKDPISKKEAKSYRALCLYQMKKFKDASKLYLELSTEKESPDLYLYLSGKSAFAAKDYNLAIQLFDDFLDQYPESAHNLNALDEIARSNYNLGNYDQAIEDWLNILIRFRNQKAFDEQETTLIKDILLGLEMAYKKSSNEELSDRLLMIPETFSSEFISFELNLLIMKLYYDAGEWKELLAQAEELRSKYPTQKPYDVQMLMVSSLINLNEHARADSMLAGMYQQAPNDEVLLKWAELEQSSRDYDTALAKYAQVFQHSKQASTWLKMLQCSEAESYAGFDSLWAMGESLVKQVPEARIIKLKALFASEAYSESTVFANEIINLSQSPLDHATAFLYLGLVDFNQAKYPSALNTFRKVMVLFPDFPVIKRQAAYYTVKALIISGARTEAALRLSDYSGLLENPELLELNQLLEAKP